MMKWGRKKSSTTPSPSPSSSSSRQSLITHAFPLSWLSRFKNVKGGLEAEEVNVKGMGKGKKGSASPKRGVSDDSWNGGRFYGRDDDSFWSLSFRKDRLKSEIGKCGSKPGWYLSDDELHSPPLDMVSQRRKARESGSLQSSYGCKVKTDSEKVEVKTRRRRALKNHKSGQESRRIWEEEQNIRGESDKENVNSTRSVPGRMIQETDKKSRKPTVCDSRRKHSISFSHSADLGTIEEDCIFEDLISEQSITFSADEKKNKKINEMMLRNENQKTARHLRRERQRRRMKQSRKVQVCSPRSPAKIECKIKAFEDMKRARNKMKKMTKEGAIKDTTNFDSFAVVKCSKDPEEDFRDSMVEMIREKGIRQPEVLEELLACYLTLNCDEYHDLIVKVFRDVWFELNQTQFHQELEFINYCYF